MFELIYVKIRPLNDEENEVNTISELLQMGGKNKIRPH